MSNSQVANKNSLRSIEGFADEWVDITVQDDAKKQYGHYPFQFMAYDNNDCLTCGTLLLGGNVVAVYKSIAQQIAKQPERLYFSVDFPPLMDVENDFVAVFSYEKGVVSGLAMPYDPLTGKASEKVYGSLAMALLISQFKSIANLK